MWGIFENFQTISALAECNKGYVVGSVDKNHLCTVEDVALLHYPKKIQLSEENITTLATGEVVYVVPDRFLL